MEHRESLHEKSIMDTVSKTEMLKWSHFRWKKLHNVNEKAKL